MKTIVFKYGGHILILNQHLYKEFVNEVGHACEIVVICESPQVESTDER